VEILCINGSSGTNSTNAKLLDAIPKLFPQQYIYRYQTLEELPLFLAHQDHHPWAPSVLAWRAAVAKSDAVIISTPEYIYNLPALLKNALEWLASSGELLKKPVMPITFLPNAPRGKKAMQSLLWSLQALDARVVTQLSLYQNEIVFNEQGSIEENEGSKLLKAAIKELGM